MDNSLVLGTVQLGMKYGLNNTTGQPSLEEALKILSAAFNSGIRTFDTSYAYGSAEDVIGEWLRTLREREDVKIISKLKPHALNDYVDGTKASEIVRKEIEKSLKRLGVGKLDGYLLHTPSYVYLLHVIEGLKKIKEEGLCDNIGVSVYNEPEAEQALESGLDYVQVPINVFDRRFERTDFFKRAQKKGVMVFARSPFLQGFLLMEAQDLPVNLERAQPLLAKFHEIIARYKVTPLQASLWFAASRARSASIVFGVETPAQLEEVINAAAVRPNKQLITELEEVFFDTNRAIVNPSLWTVNSRS